MGARIFAKFGVYGGPSQDEQVVLNLADEFRQRLADIYQIRHDRTVEFRDRRFPALWEAMVTYEQCRSVVYAIDKEIKALHSQVRDRNAVTRDLAGDLKAARAAAKSALATMKARRTEWFDYQKRFMEWWKTAADWRNVKSLSVRREAYAALQFPEEFAVYGELHVALDLQERELYRQYQDAGLHSAVRAEIVEATKPKIGATGPGMRYRYGKQPQPCAWEKLTLQFAGGVTLTELQEGTPSLRLSPIYVNHTTGGDEFVVEVIQQIGTANIPRRINYRMKLDKPFPDDAVFQRWSLAIRPNGKREVLPLLADVPAKRVGAGGFSYELLCRVTPGGVTVAQFRGDNVYEALTLPMWLVERRMQFKYVQKACDERANRYLESQGISRSRKRGERHAIWALETYCRNNPTDTAGGNLLDELQQLLAKAQRVTERSVRCIEDIYRMAAARLCRCHGSVVHPDVDLSEVKRYDTRDLLRDDPLTSDIREVLHAVAPGKLRAAIKSYGLAAGDLPDDEAPPNDGPCTDLFTSQIASLGVKTGTKPTGTNHRERYAATVAATRTDSLAAQREDLRGHDRRG